MFEHRPIHVGVLLVALLGVPLSGATSHGPVTVDPTPSGPSEADATHAVTMALGDTAAVVGASLSDVVIDYAVAQPSADVSNVGTADVERIGLDRGDDDPGSQLDVRANEISSVSGQRDGKAVRIALGGSVSIRAGDQVVVVLQNVQNPQNAGTATMNLTVNSQGGATTGTGSVTYERHDATVDFPDQETAGQQVRIASVTLSEGGFVAVQNTSGANPDAIRGTSAYLPPGTHEDVAVALDPAVTADADLVAQVYTDTDADRAFEFGASGGERDGPYRTTDDNVLGTDTAAVTDDATATPTPSSPDTVAGTPTASPTPTDVPETRGSPIPTDAAPPTDDAPATTASDGSAGTDDDERAGDDGTTNGTTTVAVTDTATATTAPGTAATADGDGGEETATDDGGMDDQGPSRGPGGGTFTVATAAAILLVMLLGATLLNRA